jgi:hypothetical protein
MKFSVNFSISETKSQWDFDIAIELLNSILKETFARQMREKGEF